MSQLSLGERVAYYSTLCEKLYSPQSQPDRAQAEKILEHLFPSFTNDPSSVRAQSAIPDGLDGRFALNITTPTGTVSALQLLFENSSSAYVQTYCLTRLKQIISSQFAILDTNTKKQLWWSLLKYPFIQSNVQTFVVVSLGKVLALLMLLGRNDMEEYRTIHLVQLFDSDYFFMGDHVDKGKDMITCRITALQLLAVIVEDINAPCFSRASAKFRTAASAFRDMELYAIFRAAFSSLESLVGRTITFTDNEQENRLKDVTLKTLVKCLSYDFSGTSPDESGDDSGTVLIPGEWKPMFETSKLTDMFFEAYRRFDPPLSAQAMNSLVLIASVRSSLFSGAKERGDFVKMLMVITQYIINTSQGLSDEDNYNEFCRFLYRFRFSTALKDVAELDEYLEWIENVAKFSLKAFESWKWAPNSSLYILGFWSRTVQSMSYYGNLAETTVEKLRRIMAVLTEAYVTCQLNAVQERIEESLDDPLDNEDAMSEPLRMLGVMSRCSYQQANQHLVSLFDPIVLQYRELISGAVTDLNAFKETLELIETKFAWLVYVSATYIGSRESFLNSDILDSSDGELTAKVLQLMDIQQSLQAQHGSTFLNQKLDLAFIYFFQQFKKAYMSGDDLSKKIYPILEERLNIKSETVMLDFIIRKIVDNLQRWGSNEYVIRQTLELFSDVAAGHAFLGYLSKSQISKQLLQNHRSSEFVFLVDANQYENRMTYYRVLSNILFFGGDISDHEFYAFLKPFDDQLQHLETFTNVEEYRQEYVLNMLQSVFLDLRGFVSSIKGKNEFVKFLEWFHSDFAAISLRAAEAWSPSPVMNVVLLFYAELTQNKNRRLIFGVSSANDILLFRNASKVIVSYGSKVLQQPITDEKQNYKNKYKGILNCFRIASNCLAGGYINFAVLRLYQDTAVDDAFSMILQLMMSIPLDDMIAFPKLTSAFYYFLEEFTREQLMAIPSIPVNAFVYMMEACERGIELSDSVVRGKACTSIFNICQFVAVQSKNPGKGTGRRRSSATLSTSDDSTHWLISYFLQLPHILPSLLASIFYLVLFDENKDLWQLSRPLYVLIMLQPGYTTKYTNAVIEQQLDERRPFAIETMEKLKDEVEWSLSGRDRENFIGNVSSFRRDLRMKNIALRPLQSPPSP